jgi:hypothetical protein
MASGLFSACGSDTTTASGTGGASTAGGGASNSSSSSSSSSTGGGGGVVLGTLSLTVSGAVSGQLTIVPGVQVYCNASNPGHMEVAALLNGTSGYSLRINAKPGTINLSTTSPNDVQVIFYDPGQRVWSAGHGYAAAGTVTANPNGSGSIDTDLASVQGATSSIHVKGSWTCP